MPINSRVGSSNCDGIGAVILSHHQISYPVGRCRRRTRFGGRRLRAHPSDIGRAKDEESSGQARGFQELSFHILYDTFLVLLLDDGEPLIDIFVELSYVKN